MAGSRDSGHRLCLSGSLPTEFLPMYILYYDYWDRLLMSNKQVPSFIPSFLSGCSPPRSSLSYVTGDTICTDLLTEIRSSTFFDHTAVQPRAVWSAVLFCGGSIIVEQSSAHHQLTKFKSMLKTRIFRIAFKTLVC